MIVTTETTETKDSLSWAYEQHITKTYPLTTHCDGEFVYVIRNPLNGLYKVGISRSPYARLQRLSSGAGVNMHHVILWESESGYDEPVKGIEDYIHKWYKKKRKIGEWFELNDKDIQDITDLLFHIGGWMLWEEGHYPYSHGKHRYTNTVKQSTTIGK